MIFYIIFTLETATDGSTTISYKKDLFICKSQAFARAKLLGDNSCVIELYQRNSWNKRQMEDEEAMERL